MTSAALGLVVVLALYLDGRAHWLALPDSFFTPWHGLLYGGLLVLGLWLLSLGVRRRPAGSSVIRSALAPPSGYDRALAGAGVFALGGVADMVWHVIFGVEEGLDALLSPTHLVLFAGASLLFTGPIFAARSRSSTRPTVGIGGALPTTLAVLSISAVAAFALSYLSAFTTIAPAQAVGHFPEGSTRHIASEMGASIGLASYLTTSLILVASLVYLAREVGLLTGTVALFFVVHATLSLMLVDFSTLGTGLILTVLAAGLAVDFVLRIETRYELSPTVRLATMTALVPVGLIVSQIAALTTAVGVAWSPELIGGVLVLSALTSLVTVATLTREPPTSRAI